MLHLRARWYLPETGTFLQKDPHPGNIHVPATFNGYNYVHQNPVNLTDPSGKYVGPIDGYLEGSVASVAFPTFPGVPIGSLPIDGTWTSILTFLYNYLDKLVALNPCLDVPTGPRWVRRHQPFWARELVYDFAHMQSAEFAPQISGSGSVDLTSDIRNIELYISLYAGPIAGLEQHLNIRGYAKNATNSAGGGLSFPAGPHVTTGLGIALNTNSADQPGTVEAMRNLLQDILDQNKNIEVTSFVFGGSVGGTVKPSIDLSGKAGGGGNVGWTTTTRMVEPLTNYIKQPNLRSEPTFGEMSGMARDIMTGIRYQTIWTDFWEDVGWEMFTPRLNNLSYGAPMGPGLPFSPAMALRFNAVSNLFHYHASSLMAHDE